MKKIFAILLICLLVSGCTTEYNLNISNNSFKENISINIKNSEIPKESPYPGIEIDDPITPFLNSETPSLFSDANALYDKKVTYNEEDIDVKMNYKYNEREFADSNSLKMCFENYEFKYKDNYSINVGGTFYCLYSDEIDINIKTNNKVTYNNADSVKGNVYTWHINSKNSDDVNIKIEMSKGISKNKIMDFVLIIVVVVIVLGVAFIINKKRVKENKL